MDNPLKEYFEQVRKETDESINQLLHKADTRPPRLHEAMRYSIFAGGKRLRPILAVAACEATDGNRKTVIPFAAALEMIHTYTLIHDDLPALDDDDLRRGHETCHVKFDEATAILAGDALLTYAAEILTRIELYDGVDPAALLTVATETLEAIGSTGTIGGQVVDIEMEEKEADLATLEYIHTHKTGKLIVASLRGAAILSGADEKSLDLLTEYGRNIGLAFQVIDDILDVKGDHATLGKTIGADEAKGKLTYPSALGMEESGRLATRLTERAVSNVSPLGTNGNRLADIAKYLLSRVS